MMECYNFYPRPRVEGDLPLPMQSAGQRDFYPRPRVEGDLDRQFLSSASKISIHALA